jgi:transposase
VRERTAEVNRLPKTLEGANIKLAGVAAASMGTAGREMLEALVAGSTDAAAMAHLARGRMREKIPQLARAWAGRFAAHQRFLVARQLAHLDFLDGTLAPVSAEVAERVSPLEEGPRGHPAHLDPIPGSNRRSAASCVAEVGTDLRRFPRPEHLAAWAGMAPGNNESAGQRRSGKTRQGSPW